MSVRHIHIPRQDLELSGVDAETARQVLDRLPAALDRALAPRRRGTTVGETGNAADAIADRVAGQIAARVRAGGGL